MTATRNIAQRGLGSVAIIVVLVGLAALAAAMVRLGSTAQGAATRDLLGTRASLTANAAVEWGLYQAFKGGWTTCSNDTKNLDLRSETGMVATVTCDSQLYNEGESAPGTPRQVRVYTIDAVACSAAACPDATAAARPGYVERRRQVHATN
jgi:MSHA biogenesis protein MshP